MGFHTTIDVSATDPAGSAKQLLDALLDHDVVTIRPEGDPGDLRAYYDEFVEASGTPIDIAEDYATGGAPTGARWSEIRYDADIPDMAAFRHSKNAQPLHTDESYVSSEIGVMLFYCVHAAPAGGETVFVGGRELVGHLADTAPELLEDLTTIDVTYQKAGDAKTRPIIDLSGAFPTFNFNYFCIEADQSAAAIELNQRFHDHLQHTLPQELIVPVGLQPGEGVAWRDDRVLHGRNAFEATKTNDRLIWKTGVVLDAA